MWGDDLLRLPLINYKNDHNNSNNSSTNTNNNNNNVKRNVRNVAGSPQKLTPIIAVPDC